MIDIHTKNNAVKNQHYPVASCPSNPPMDFPCIDKLNTRTAELDNGPEPSYDKIVTGYEKFEYPHPFLLNHGGILPNFEIAYETWGQLNEKRDNAILIHTGLSASSHAKSHPKNTSPGWWENFIGPGSYIDTNKFFVICTNVIGGCYGSTGPSAIDPADGERYATRFPIITIFDMVRAQFKLLDHLGIDKLHASVGSSMGGMQVRKRCSIVSIPCLIHHRTVYCSCKTISRQSESSRFHFSLRSFSSLLYCPSSYAKTGLDGRSKLE